MNEVELAALRRRRLKTLAVLVCLLVSLGSVRVWFTYRNWHMAKRFEQGMAAVKARDTKTIAEVLKELEGKPDYTTKCDFLRGALFLQNGDLGPALEHLDRAAVDLEFRNHSRILAGEGLYRAGRGGDAQRLWSDVLIDDPNSVDAHRWLAVLCYDVGAMQDALNHLERVASLAPDDPRPHRLMGLIKKDFERFEDAVRHYNDALKRDPNMPDAEGVRLELAESQIKLRNYDSALAVLERCQESPFRRTLEAECHYSMGRVNEAIALVDLAIQQDPELSRARLLKGTFLLENGEANAAVETFRQVVEGNPYDYESRYKLSQALRRSGATAEAERESAKSDDLRKQWERFSELNTKAITHPQDSQLRFELGQLAEQLGRSDLAVNWYKATLGLSPQHVAARKRLEQLKSP